MVIMINRLRTLISMKKTKTNKKISTQEYIYIQDICISNEQIIQTWN